MQLTIIEEDVLRCLADFTLSKNYNDRILYCDTHTADQYPSEHEREYIPFSTYLLCVLRGYDTIAISEAIQTLIDYNLAIENPTYSHIVYATDKGLEYAN